MFYDYYEETADKVWEVIQWDYIDDMFEIVNATTDSEKRDRIDALYEKLYDECWVSDGVTGNGSGSFTFNRKQAEEYVLDNMKLALEAYNELGISEQLVKDMNNEDWEKIDVTIRCYVLSDAINKAIGKGL